MLCRKKRSRWSLPSAASDSFQLPPGTLLAALRRLAGKHVALAGHIRQRPAQLDLAGTAAIATGGLDIAAATREVAMHDDVQVVLESFDLMEPTQTQHAELDCRWNPVAAWEEKWSAALERPPGVAPSSHACHGGMG